MRRKTFSSQTEFKLAMIGYLTSLLCAFDLHMISWHVCILPVCLKRLLKAPSLFQSAMWDKTHHVVAHCISCAYWWNAIWGTASDVLKCALGEAINGVAVFQVARQSQKNIKNFKPFQWGKKNLMRFVAFKEFEMCQHNTFFDTAWTSLVYSAALIKAALLLLV